MPSWDECTAPVQAQIIAFNQIRSYDDIEIQKKLAGCK